MIWPKNSIYEFFRMMKRGLKAVITQSYTEANVKNGLQFSNSIYVPALGANAVMEFAITTGSKPISVKGRTFEYDGLGIKVEVFKDCSITGGTPVIPDNLNSRSMNVCEARVVSGFTSPVYGDHFLKPRTYLGDNSPGVSSIVRVSEEIFGLETIYKENSTFIVRVTSIDGSESQRLASFFTFYEGFFDLPDNS